MNNLLKGKAMKGLEKSFKEAALAVIAAENGMISPQKLVHIFSDWVNSPGVSIRKKLEEALPEENRALLDLLGSESVEDEPQNRSIEVLMDSVNRIKEQTRMAVGTPTGQGDNTSDRLITDETPGKYMIQGELARGGAGRVLIALDRHIGREIAMKELLLDLRDKRDGKIRNDPQTVSLRNRFLREARVTGQLEHPSIVPVYEIGRHPDGIFYYTMRMVKGKTLNQAIKICNSLEDRLELLPHFYNICNAVAYAHSKGVINRDLKPSNVMIGEFGETVVLDWGLAKVKGQQDMGAEKLQTGLRLFLDADVGKTVVGYAIGTPSYMPPEQAEGKVDDIDETSDTYSLGAILYQLLTGDPPYSGKTASEILRKVVDTDPQKATSVDRNIPPELAAIAHKAMSKKKKDRYSSVTELIDELNSFMSGGNVKVYEYSSMEILKRFASKNKAVFISSILILVMLSLSTLMIAWYYDREVTAKKTAQKEKIVSQYRTAQAFNEKAARLETQKQFLSSRIYAAASLYFNPANRNSPEYVPWFRKNFKDSDVLLSDAASRFYHRHFHRGALLETGFDTDCTITALAVSSDLSSIFAGCGNGDVAVYSYPGLKEKNRFKTGSQIDSIDLTEDGKFAAFAGISGAVTIADLEKNTVSTLIKKGLGIKSIRFSPDGSQLLSCGIDSIIKIVNLTSGEAVEIKGHAGIVNDAVFVDEKTILSASADSTVRIWDKDAGSEISLYQTDEEVKKLAVINGPGIILAGTENGSVIVLSKVDLRFIRKLSYHGSP
ncbi:MAG TPA: serine/threonine-protein kinase, partial [bacterium]|nr:serine/threonine-protein kinase [bacterium]